MKKSRPDQSSARPNFDRTVERPELINNMGLGARPKPIFCRL